MAWSGGHRRDELASRDRRLAPSGAAATGWQKALGAAAAAATILSGCAPFGSAPSAVACPALPDATRTLEQAWQAYQPDQPLSPAVSVRRRLFVLQALLLSAGMYDDPPSDPARVYTEYAPQFVRDFGMSRNPGLAAALGKLSGTLEQVRERSEADLGSNCGLILARRALREDPVNVSTDWVLQTVTWGLAAMFQSSIRQLVHEAAQACAAQPDVAGKPEAVFACTVRRIGL
jgi:hypothetical protein